MDVALKVLAVRVKNKQRNNPERIKICQMLLDDFPFILKNEFENHFMKKPYNEGKDAVDFYFIKIHQINRFVKDDEPPRNHSPRPKPILKEKSEYKPPEAKETVRLGDLIKNKKSLDKY